MAHYLETLVISRVPEAKPWFDFNICEQLDGSVEIMWVESTKIPKSKQYKAKDFSDKSQVDSHILDSERATKMSELDAQCKHQITDGFYSSALGKSMKYPCKDMDQTNLNSAVTMSLVPNLPANWTHPLWCQDGTEWKLLQHTAKEVQQVGLDYKNHVNTAINTKNVLSNKVSSATTVEEIRAIIW